MKGMRHAIIDILVTALILVAVLLDQEWARWIIIIYTPVMLVLKAISVIGPRAVSMLKGSEKEPSIWLLHVLYGLNVVVLGLAAWWYLFAGWLAIWILSIVHERRALK